MHNTHEMITIFPGTIKLNEFKNIAIPSIFIILKYSKLQKNIQHEIK